jgi:hypothetical protein
VFEYEGQLGGWGGSDDGFDMLTNRVKCVE